jgi:RNA polymerase sigma-70 factor (ECF subfamily)
MNRLRQEFVDKKKTTEFETLRPFLTGNHADRSYYRAAAELELSQEAVRQAAHRLRKRYRDLLRVEVADTVSEEEEIDDEIRGLFVALGS